MVKELAGRLAALDPDAGAAVRVIAYFDRLVDSHAGLETIVRGAAVLSGCPARLADDERRVHVRVEPDGRRHDDAPPLDAGWLNALCRRRRARGVVAGTARARPAPSTRWCWSGHRPRPRSVLERTRGRSSTHTDDPAFVETLFDDQAPPSRRRLHAARRLGLHGSTPARALALADGTGADSRPVTAVVGPRRATAGGRQSRASGRRLRCCELPASWAGGPNRVSLHRRGHRTGSGTAGCQVRRTGRARPCWLRRRSGE